ncbi:VanZ family protein [Halomicroarcula sp. F13]|uniref:VanZ family protein n=1 Tax=Haloarcula rubra TaxID=2487747 RepID=A0AAW4PYM8_9EURY|nr:VanZ family protein [Halomicroarcula rubra]MBX0325377.1 VanZ family protein [Halomicroarcula rubra]
MDPSRFRRYAPAVAFAGLLLVTSLVPVPESGADAVPTLLGVALDKWVHAGSYGVLTTLLAWGRRTRTVAVVAALATLAVGYGAGIEFLQGLVATRDTSGADFLANAVGAGLAGVGWLAVRDRIAREA